MMILNIKDIFKDDDKIHVEEHSIPIRIWNKNWGFPSFIKHGKISKKIRSHGKRVTVTKNSLWCAIEDLDSFRKRYKNLPRMWRKGSSPREFEYVIRKNKLWIRMISEWKHDNKVGSNRFFIKGDHLRFKLLKKQIGIWYKSGEGQIRCLILPSRIRLDREMSETVGILHGEMTEKENLRGGTTFRVTNAEPIIIKHVVDTFRKLNVQRHNWRVSLSINAKGKSISEIKKRKLNLFWSKTTGTPIKNFGKVTVNKSFISKFSPYGIVQFRYNSELFRYFIINLILCLQKTILENRTLAIDYLRGLIAAEGGVGLTDNNKIRFVQIGVTKEDHKEFYLALLKALGLKSYNVYSERIEIYSFNNFRTLSRWDIFRLNPRRKIIFEKSFSKLESNYRKPLINLSHLQPVPGEQHA